MTLMCNCHDSGSIYMRFKTLASSLVGLIRARQLHHTRAHLSRRVAQGHHFNIGFHERLLEGGHLCRAGVHLSPKTIKKWSTASWRHCRDYIINYMGRLPELPKIKTRWLCV